MMRKTIALASVAAATLFAQTAHAETLRVSGVYAAGQSAPSEFHTLVVERFDGNEGAKFALELRNAIARARIDGASYFDVRRGVGPSEDAGPTAWIVGTAFSEVEHLPAGTTEETKCVRKDEDGECLRRKTYVYECSELSVRFTGEVQMLDARDELVYDRGFSTHGAQRYCANDSVAPSVSAMVTGMVNQLAWQVRRDIAPIERSEDIRVLESRKGMDRALRKPFKKALKLTKSDWSAACIEFDRLNAMQPGNVTLTFNAGLCREVVGDLAGAEDLYRRALELEPGKNYPSEGLSRLASRRRAEDQLAVHFAEPEGEQYAENNVPVGIPVMNAEAGTQK